MGDIYSHRVIEVRSNPRQEELQNDLLTREFTFLRVLGGSI
jgi:hypothetical protein